MKKTALLLRIAVAVAVLCSAMGLVARGESVGSSASSRVQVDESLFLVRLLETMYEKLPDPTQIKDARELDDVVASRKLLTARIRTRIEDSKLDRRLVPLFGEIDSVMDAIVSFHASKGSISGRYQRKALKDSATTGLKYGVSGGLAYSALQSAHDDGNTSVEGTALVALGSAAFGFLSDMWQQAEDDKETEKAELRSRIEETMNLYRGAVARAQSVANALATENAWRRGEVGWTLDQSFSANVQRMVASSDTQGLLRVATDQIEARPRDPFIRLFRVQLFFAQDGERKTFTIKDYTALAKECLFCAELVPSANLYDDFRKEYLFYGVLAAGKARSIEAENGTLPYESTEVSRLALSMADQCLSLDSSDASGWLRLIRSAALLGDGQVQEAAAQASQINELQRDNPLFQYQCACILSRMGKFAPALVALRRTFDLGFTEVGNMKKDPDLAALRRDSPKEFGDLVEVKFKLKIDYGVLNDDLILQNNSAFPITNVKMHTTLEQDGKQWKRDLRMVGTILPGKSYRWVNAVSIPGDRLTASKTSIECDQSK